MPKEMGRDQTIGKSLLFPPLLIYEKGKQCARIMSPAASEFDKEASPENATSKRKGVAATLVCQRRCDDHKRTTYKQPVILLRLQH